MLKKLSVQNYAIIDHLMLEPDAHLNTVTGETGAGKSIIMGALALILGERADTSVLIDKTKKCVIEAHFDVTDQQTFQEAIEAEGLDDDKLCIIRREITAAGKSRAFINDTPVTLPTLQTMTSLLVDMQQQFGHLSLQTADFQIQVVDAIGAIELKTYSELFEAHKMLTSELASLTGKQQQWQKEADYKQFLFDELAEAVFTPQEIEQTEQRLHELGNAEKILSALQLSRASLTDGPQPILTELRKVCLQLDQISSFETVAALRDRCYSSLEELKDIAAEIETTAEKVSLDPELLAKLEERLNLGYRLLKKHSLQTTEELLNLQRQLEQELQLSLDLSDEIEKTKRQLEKNYKALLDKALVISQQRSRAIESMTPLLNKLLHSVGIPNAAIKIDLQPLAEPSVRGIDQIIFLWDANKSQNFQPIAKAASGGELSRIMLCIKSLTAQAMNLPTLIFDEVDAGISGEAARQVATLLSELSRTHQIICITHQPQVAAKGTRHFFVYKEPAAKNRISTKVRVLQGEERIRAIAQMIGGTSLTEAALQHASELMH